MDCLQARLLHLFDRPGAEEIAPEEAESLREHLETCPDCRRAAEREQRVDDVLQRAMRHVPAPAAGLEERILLKLSQQRRPRPWTWVAAAAALLVTIGLGTAWYMQPAPYLAAEWLTNHRPLSSPVTVTAWFQERGIPVEIPPELDFQYLDSWEVVSLQNRQVAKLLFVNRGAVAHVYIVPRSEFRIDKNELVQSLNLETLDSSDSDFLFLVIFSSGGREAFFRGQI